MNNAPSIAIIGWETRNWRHQKRAEIWCKDYGFKPVTKSVYAAELYARERREVNAKFKGLFVGKTEKFFFVTLCKSCFTGGMRGMPRRRDLSAKLPFELVQMPKNG